MAKQPSQGEGIKSKLKSMLGLKKGGSAITVGHEEREIEEIVITNDILKDIGKESTSIHRCKILRDLTEKVAVKKLEEHAVEALWHAIQDLLLPSNNAEVRQTAFRFLTALAAGQYNKLGMLRGQFFRLVVNHNIKEDLGCRIDLFQVLTDKGKDISYCEQIGTFLLTFLTDAIRGDRAEEILLFLINLIHFNSSFLDGEIITALVNLSCNYCNQAKDEKEIKILLELFDAIVSYSGLPSDALQPLISTLCKIVNFQTFSLTSWKLMKKLAGTRLGHSAIYIMCSILESDSNVSDISLLRGAVFFIGMCVWGSKRVATLRHKPISLLPSIKRGLRCNHPIVAHEAGLSLQRLVKKYGKELEVVTWDLLLDITECLLKLLETLTSDQESLKENVHGLISSIEDLYCARRFGGSSERFFSIIEKCSRDRPESSVIRLLEFVSEKIHPLKDRWLEKLKDTVEKYYKQEDRSIIRVKVLDMLSRIVSLHRYWYEDDIIEGVIVPYLGSVYNEKDNSVRLVAAQLLVDLALACNTPKCMELLSISEKLINRYADEDQNLANTVPQNEESFRDIEITVNGLIQAFKIKIFDQPISNAIRIYEILISHVIGHYVYGAVGDSSSNARKQVFKFLLGLRADSLHRIGVLDLDEQEKSVRHSVYVSCKASDIQEDGCKAVTASEVIEHYKVPFVQECPYYKAFDAILNGLKDEWDWTVFELFLKYLPQQLQCKSLVISGKGDVNTLCALLCKMSNDRLYLNKMKNISHGIGRPEFLSMVFPSLVALATYCEWLDKNKQYDLITSMELGLNSQCGRICITCLTICSLEMRSAMMRILPSVLVKLSQISATIPMSIPVLEFLSCLKEIPSLYSNFVEEQYMSIFAIALPYTDAYKYSKYTVSLAHYVITSWFTRCRLSFRRGFVKLITKGLKSSAILLNQGEVKAKIDSNSGRTQEGIEQTREFHDEMTEVCLDMMARYTFSTCTTQPRRSPLVEFLLTNGVSQTWLLGNMLVTITTNGKANGKCSLCSDFGRKRQAAKRAAAKVKKLLAMSNSAQTGEKRALGRSRTVSDVRSSTETHTIHRSRTIPGYLSKEGLAVQNVSHELNGQETKVEKEETPLISGKHDCGSKEKKDKCEHLQKEEELENPRRNTDTSIKIHHTSSYTEKAEASEKVIEDPCGRNSSAMSNAELPLVEKLLQTSDSNYGSIYSPSKELLFSRQSSQTDVVIGTSKRPRSESDSKDFPVSDFNCDKRSSVDASLNQDSSAGVFVETSIQVDEPGTPFENVCNGKEIASSEPVCHSTSAEVSLDVAKDVQEIGVMHGSSCSYLEDSLGPRSDRVDSEMSSKTDRLVAEYEIIDFTPSGDEQDTISQDDPLRPSLSETICNCSCEGWAEIMIRRPCGNTSWITKIENRRIPDSNSSVLADISGLAATLGNEEQSSERDLSVDDILVKKQSLLASSSVGNTVTKSGRSTRSNSGTTRPETNVNILAPRRRRRFSTGSLDIPGAFRFDVPSPGSSVTTSKDDELSISLQGKGYFEKPSVGQSPVTPFVKTSSWMLDETFSAKVDLREAVSKDTDSNQGGIDIPKDGASLIDKMEYSQHQLGSDHRKCTSGSVIAPSSLPVMGKTVRPVESTARTTDLQLQADTRVLQNPKTLELTVETAVELEVPIMVSNTLTTEGKVKTQNDIPYRPRGKTVSGLPQWRLQNASSSHQMTEEETWQGSSNPHFLFLQLFYSPFLNCNTMYRPVLLESGEVIDRAVKILDGIPSFDTHKIGVIYVGRNQQNDEKAILSNVYGSSRYAHFISGLGDLIKLSECSTTETYTGGLDRNGNDGKYTYSWKDVSSQVIFHIATMMPNKTSDPSCHSKKLHIGNNFVTIVYNDSEREYQFGTIKGQFNFGEIIVSPMHYGSNTVTVRVKPELQDLVLNTGPHVVSDENLPLLVRQIAVHVNMVTVIHQKDKKPGLAYGCNWLERLKQIKRMRSKVSLDPRQRGPLATSKGNTGTSKPAEISFTDFTDYT